MLGVVGNWGINILGLMVIMAVPQVCCYLLFSDLPPPKRFPLLLQSMHGVVDQFPVFNIIGASLS